VSAEFVLVVITASNSPDDRRIAGHFGETGGRINGYAAFVGAVERVRL
jgi:hypothetical protein